MHDMDLRKWAIGGVAVVNGYFTVEYFSIITGNPNAADGFLARWAIGLIVLNLVVATICTMRFGTAPEYRPSFAYFKPLAHSLAISILTIPYFFALVAVAIFFYWEF